MPRGAKMSLAFNEPKLVALHSNQGLPPSMHYKRKEITNFVCKKINGNYRGPTPDEKFPLS
jgi:hypothetical protein